MKKAITVRIEDSLIDQLNKLDGTKTRHIESALMQYICNTKSNTNAIKSNTNAIHISNLENENKSLKKQIETLEDDKETLNKFLEREQILHMQTQKALEPPEKIKKRWKFWKR